MTKIEELKIALYDVIEEQSLLAARHQQVESRKNELAKMLGEAREAEAKEKANEKKAA